MTVRDYFGNNFKNRVYLYLASSPSVLCKCGELVVEDNMTIEELALRIYNWRSEWIMDCIEDVLDKYDGNEGLAFVELENNCGILYVDYEVVDFNNYRYIWDDFEIVAI